MVAANNAIFNTVGASISGVTNTLTVTNPSNTASSAARSTVTVGGTSAGNPTRNWNVAGSTDWEMGIDNADSQKWKLSQATALGTNDTIVAYKAGSVVKPRQPAFLAHLNTSVTNVTGDGTQYTVLFDTVDFDQASNYAAGTGLFTAPVTGVYSFQTSVNVNTITAANQTGRIDFIRNGTQLYHGFTIYPGITTIGNWVGAITVKLTAADTFGVTITFSGSTKTNGVSGAASFGGVYVTYFSGSLLC